MGEYVYNLISGDTVDLDEEHGDEFDNWVMQAVDKIENDYKEGVENLLKDFPTMF